MITVDDELKGPNLAYHDGIRANRTGYKLEDCPEKNPILERAWKRGYEIAEKYNDQKSSCFVLRNDLIDKWAVNLNGMNYYKPFQIREIELELRFNNDKWQDELVVKIRGADTCWLIANDCFINIYDECKEYSEIKLKEEDQKRINKMIEPKTIIV